MWDADTAGVQIGTSNTFNAVPMTDGRFALGLNFGASAFDGSNRWIQVEFRNPAGSGLYLALNPRDKITATPYALYALNGANGVWVYDTKQQSVSVLGKKVGIGTGNPTAALEVVSATGGDDSVKLPAGSVGGNEIASGTFSVGSILISATAQNTMTVEQSRSFVVDASGTLVLSARLDITSSPHTTYLLIDGNVVWSDFGDFGSFSKVWSVQLATGTHLLTLRVVDSWDTGFNSTTVELEAIAVLAPSEIKFQ
jgi:hypothetical protein